MTRLIEYNLVHSQEYNRYQVHRIRVNIDKTIFGRNKCFIFWLSTFLNFLLLLLNDKLNNFSLKMYYLIELYKNMLCNCIHTKKKYINSIQIKKSTITISLV